MINSLRYASRGLAYAFRAEQNFRIQTVAGILAIVGAWYFNLPSWQVILVILLIILVMSMELLNTTFEYFTDLLKPRLHHYVLVIKEIMAGAVLLISVGAAVIGLIIFLPYFISLFR